MSHTLIESICLTYFFVLLLLYHSMPYKYYLIYCFIALMKREGFDFCNRLGSFIFKQAPQDIQLIV
jgi:hypothetical protein